MIITFTYRLSMQQLDFSKIIRNIPISEILDRFPLSAHFFFTHAPCSLFGWEIIKMEKAS